MPAGPPRHPLTGEVLGVDRDRLILRVAHDAIPGVMPAMPMEFPITKGDAAILAPGMRMRGELVDLGQGEFRLERIWPDDRVARTAVDDAAKALAQDTTIRGKGAYREIGEAVPDFTLYDQNGKVFASGRLRGKQFMLNFIYTRCPVANMCPLATQKMTETQRLARETGVGEVEFVSISWDPYDTPGVLREYAESRGIDTTNFSFLNGPKEALTNLLVQFGVLTGPSDNPLMHTLATVLVDASGRIVHRVDGSQWDPRDFVGRMKR